MKTEVYSTTKDRKKYANFYEFQKLRRNKRSESLEDLKAVLADVYDRIEANELQ